MKSLSHKDVGNFGYLGAKITTSGRKVNDIISRLGKRKSTCLEADELLEKQSTEQEYKYQHI